MTRYAPLVPDDARDGVKELLKGLDEGLSYDEVQDRAYDLVEAVEDWRALVRRANTLRRGGAQRCADSVPPVSRRMISPTG